MSIRVGHQYLLKKTLNMSAMRFNKQLSCEIARNIVWYLADEAVGRVG